MSDTILALVLTAVLIAALFAWVPLLYCTESLTRRCFKQSSEELPGLLEEEAVPQVAGEVV